MNKGDPYLKRSRYYYIIGQYDSTTTIEKKDLSKFNVNDIMSICLFADVYGTNQKGRIFANTNFENLESLKPFYNQDKDFINDFELLIICVNKDNLKRLNHVLNSIISRDPLTVNDEEEFYLSYKMIIFNIFCLFFILGSGIIGINSKDKVFWALICLLALISFLLVNVYQYTKQRF